MNTKGGFKAFDSLVASGLSLKLTVFALLTLLPVLIFGGLMFQDGARRISFLEREIRGASYLEKVWPLLVQAVNSRDKEEFPTELLQQYADVASVFDLEFATRPSSALLSGSIRDSGSSPATMKAAVAHMRKVAENSNLILDDQVSEIYLVYSNSFELPDTVQSIQNLTRSLGAVSDRQFIDANSQIRLSVAKHDVEKSVASAVAGLNAALASASDENVQKAIAPAIAAFQSSLEAMNKAMDSAFGRDAMDPIPAGSAAKVNAAALEVTKSSAALWKTSNAELTRMLSERRSAMLNRQMSALIASIASFLLAGLTLVLVVRSIRDPIGKLIARMHELRGGTDSFTTPYLDLKNEVGDIARAVEAARLNAAELGRARAEIDSRLSEETSRSADTGQFLQEISSVVKAAADGEFGKRLPQSGRNGFLFELSRSLNHLLQIIETGIGDTSKIINSLAGGEVNFHMEGNYKGIFAQLMSDVNMLGEQLRGIASRIGSATGSVQGATKEIGAGVLDLSSRTEQQASSLEETAASMEELAATVRQNADNAQEANQLAAAARQLAVGGGDIASQAVVAMDKIEQSSHRVSEIVGLIQEIAFQTNILALNAAVEAARAGEAGRGFAVVANEVRALAQRSAQASKDIKELITNTRGNIGEGVTLVQQAGASLTEIVTSARKVADIVSEIAAASQEQSAGIDQVSRAITNMDEMTQQNAALVEETNAALHSAQIQVEELRQAVSFFKSGAKLEAQGLVAPAIPSQPALSQLAQPTLHEKLRELAQRMAKMPSRAKPAPEQYQTAINSDWKEF